MSINGTYVLEKNENMESFLKGLGLKEERIEKMCCAKPTVTYILSGDKLDITSKGQDSVHNTLTLGAPSTYSLASGFEIEVNLSLAGNSGKGTLKRGDHCGEFTLDFTDTHLTEVFSAGPNSCKRIFKKV